MRRWAVLAGLVMPAVAAAQPRLVPSSDASITYHVTGAAADQLPGDGSQTVQLRWDAGNQRLRAEPVGGPVFALVDLARRVSDIVFPAQRSMLEFPLRGGDPQSLLGLNALQFSRRGAGRVAGLDCTEWSVRGRKLDGTGCVTADGVILRAEGLYDGRQGSLQAVAIDRTRIAPRVTTPPEGYFTLPMAGAR